MIESAFLAGEGATECRRLKSLAQFVDKFAQGCLVSAVPHPLSQLLCLDQARFCQNRHVMGDRRLRKVNPRLEIRSAKAHILADGTSSALLESLQNSAAGWVGDGVQRAIQGLLRVGHGNDSNRTGIDGCQCWERNKLREGSAARDLGYLPAVTIPVVRARTEIPRFARDDSLVIRNWKKTTFSGWDCSRS